MAVISKNEVGPGVVALLDTLGFAEGTSTSPITEDRGYDVIVSGVDGKHRMENYDAHPFANGRPPIVVVAPGVRPNLPNGVKSTASGRYQFILATWKGLAEKLGLTDFSPLSQDRACIELLRQHGVIDLLTEGKVQDALVACGGSWGWASMPGSTAGQGGKAT